MAESRIEYLTRLRNEANEKMREAQSLPYGMGLHIWTAAERDYNRSARELTWLLDIDRNLKIPHEWGANIETAFQVGLVIRFYEHRFLTPFNMVNTIVYTEKEPSPVIPDLDILDVPSYRMQYGYSSHLVDDNELPPFDYVVKEFHRAYVRNFPALDKLLNGVRYANRALEHAKTFSKWDVEGVALDLIDTVPDQYQKMAKRVVKYAVEHHTHQIDWNPFGEMF